MRAWLAITFVNGDAMVYVKGNNQTDIATLTELGMATDQIRIRPQFYQKPIKVENWGEASPEIQFMLASVQISMNVVHFDTDVLDTCVREANGGAAAAGTMVRTGTRLGGGAARFVFPNHFIGLNIAAPVSQLPWRFYHAYLSNNPFDWPLGNEKSVVTLQWTAVPYPPNGDPWNGGLGASGVLLWDRQLDT